MGLFWKRKSGAPFVSLKLNEPSPVKTPRDNAEQAPEKAVERSVDAASANTVPEGQPASSFPTVPAGIPIEPVPTGGGPTPIPVKDTTPAGLATGARSQPTARETGATRPDVSLPKPVAPVPSRSPFQTSVLGLNLSMEELQ